MWMDQISGVSSIRSQAKFEPDLILAFDVDGKT